MTPSIIVLSIMILFITILFIMEDFMEAIIEGTMVHTSPTTTPITIHPGIEDGEDMVPIITVL